MLVGRTVREIKALLEYPIWIARGKPAPDNHIAKKSRILKLSKEYNCSIFIETGTFYGQMLKFASKHFNLAMSVELFQPLYEINFNDFKKEKKVKIFLGNSANKLSEMMENTEEKILFWLDGHYSGNGTACGEQVSPIISELLTIKTHKRNDHCILIDDARLFNGHDGYPTLEETKNALLSINENYQIYIDNDCIVSVSKNH